MILRVQTLSIIIKGVEMSGGLNKLDLVKQKLSICTICPNLEPPPILFESPPDNVKVFYVARNPGFYETVERRPLIGAAGMVFNGELVRIGCDRSKVWVGNLANCYSEKDRSPTFEEFSKCFKFLKASVQILKPTLLVVMGEAASKFLIPNIRWKFDRGKPVVSVIQGVKLVIVPIMHPASAVHKGSNSMKVIQDMNNVRLLLQKIPEKYWSLG